MGSTTCKTSGQRLERWLCSDQYLASLAWKSCRSWIFSTLVTIEQYSTEQEIQCCLRLYSSRSILERYQFSPLRDLEKNRRTGLIRLISVNDNEQSEYAMLIGYLQQAIVDYFRSRNEDNIKRAIPVINSEHANIHFDIAVKDKMPTEMSMPPISSTRNESIDLHQTAPYGNVYFHAQNTHIRVPNAEEHTLLSDLLEDSVFDSFSLNSFGVQSCSDDDRYRQRLYSDDFNGHGHVLSMEDILF
jgi:hypothetical protein